MTDGICGSVINVRWCVFALIVAISIEIPVFAQGTAGRPVVRTSQKYTASAELKARIWTYPEGTVDREAVKPKSSNVTFVGREPTVLCTAPAQGSVAPGRIPLSSIAAVDFEVNYERFEVSMAMAKSDWPKAIGILRKAYTPFFIYLDVPENNVLEGSFDLGVTMFKCARSSFRKATTEEERQAARQQYSAAGDVFNQCAKATWSPLGALAKIRACHCMVLVDSEKARKAARTLDAMETPVPGEETYGYYWLLKAELAKLEGNVTNELDAAVKSVSFENKDVETFPDALLLTAECYEKLGNPFRARDVYFEVAKLFTGTDWAEDALARLEKLMSSNVTRTAEETTAESTFFGLEEDMNKLADGIILMKKNAGTIFDVEEEESAVSDTAAK